jgi:hemerythrin-like domain-containing protein
MSDEAKPNTNEMVVMHRLFRRELTLLPELLRATAPGDVARAEVLTAWTSEVLDLLHHHHTGEDDLLWPLLLERCPPDTELVHRMEAQHAGIDPLIAEITTLSGEFIAAAAPGAGARLAGVIDTLAAALFRHLDEEELEILPLAREHLSVAEWDALGARGRAATPPDRAFIVLGAILEDTDDAERDGFLSKLPPPVRDLWVNVGVPAYSGHVRSIRG